MQFSEMSIGGPKGPEELPFVQIEKLFSDAVSRFTESAPDFSAITNIIKKLKEEIRLYNADFSVLGEATEFGGGIENQVDRIKGMRDSLPEFEKMVKEAEKIIESNESFYGPYKEQIKAA